jgi:hypothetical protein
MSTDHDQSSDLRSERKDESHGSSAGEPYGSGAGCAVRLAWLVVGPLALAFVAAVLARQEDMGLVIGSLVYWGGVAAVLLLRYVDVAKFAGHTADGERASMDHVKRYAVRAVAIGAAAYGIALWIRL